MKPVQGMVQGDTTGSFSELSKKKLSKKNLTQILSYVN
jgi:hypothetical protein